MAEILIRYRYVKVQGSAKSGEKSSIKLQSWERGREEGHDPYFLDVTELVRQAWEEVSERTITRS